MLSGGKEGDLCVSQGGRVQGPQVWQKGRCGHVVFSASVVVSTQGMVPFRRLVVLQASKA